MKSWKDRKEKTWQRPALKVKKLTGSAQLPTRGTPGSAGMDIYSTEDFTLWPGDIKMIHTGVAVEIPEGYAGLLMTRSSMGKIGVRVAAGANCIDRDFRGEVMVCLRNDGQYLYQANRGERVAQLVIIPYLDCIPIAADELTPTMRGGGGFGSTGR